MTVIVCFSCRLAVSLCCTLAQAVGPAQALIVRRAACCLCYPCELLL